MYPADQAIMDAQITEDHLLFSFLYFLRQEDDGATLIDVDLPIKELFSPTLRESSFIFAVGLFELHHALNIPDEFCDWNQSVRELLRRIATLPTLNPAEYRKHLVESVRTIQLSDRAN
jgi:hypothetical protein